MTPKIAVIGSGYLGRFHAQKYRANADVELIAVCDNDQKCADKVAAELGVKAYYNYHDLLGKVDAVSIVVPTKLHYQVAKLFLENGVHILLEKPMTTTVAEADELIKIATNKQIILQIGHLERFNPALIALQNQITKPLFIDTHRLSPFNPRGADVNVILDLMIHDIDIIQGLLNSPIAKIDTLGIPVLTDKIDICNARLRFENGCVANVSASRVSSKSERKMRIFQKNNYIAVDFQAKTLATYHNNNTQNTTPDQASIVSEVNNFANTDALNDEITAFINSIKTNAAPIVSGVEGRAALFTALTIIDKINGAKL